MPHLPSPRSPRERTGGTGLDPAASSVSRCRHGRPCSAIGGVTCGRAEAVPRILPHCPGHPRVNVGPALGPAQYTLELGESSGDRPVPPLGTASPSLRLFLETRIGS